MKIDKKIIGYEKNNWFWNAFDDDVFGFVRITDFSEIKNKNLILHPGTEAINFLDNNTYSKWDQKQSRNINKTNFILFYRIGVINIPIVSEKMLVNIRCKTAEFNEIAKIVQNFINNTIRFGKDDLKKLILPVIEESLSNPLLSDQLTLIQDLEDKLDGLLAKWGLIFLGIESVETSKKIYTKTDCICLKDQNPVMSYLAFEKDGVTMMENFIIGLMSPNVKIGRRYNPEPETIIKKYQRQNNFDNIIFLSPSHTSNRSCEPSSFLKVTEEEIKIYRGWDNVGAFEKIRIIPYRKSQAICLEYVRPFSLKGFELIEFEGPPPIRAVFIPSMSIYSSDLSEENVNTIEGFGLCASAAFGWKRLGNIENAKKCFRLALENTIDSGLQDVLSKEIENLK